MYYRNTHKEIRIKQLSFTPIFDPSDEPLVMKIKIKIKMTHRIRMS